MKTRLIIFVGTGGVGKTTTAASVGLALAELGHKAVTITIDPAKRLAQALGLDELSNEAQLVKKFENGGEFHAQWLDQKTALSDLVRRTAKREDLVEKILKHRLFEIIEGHLGGLEEYLSLEKLLAIRETEKYDFCVLDTAPSRHALDFIDSPKHLIQFFDEGILSRFVKSDKDESEKKRGFWAGLLKTGQEKAFNLFKGVFGSTFFSELGELLNLSRPLHKRLVQVAAGANEWIRSSEASVVMITAPDSKSFREVELMTTDLRARGLRPPYRVLINRSLPTSALPERIQSDPDLYRHLESRQKVQAQLIQDLATLNRFIPKLMTYPVVNPRDLNLLELSHAGREILRQWTKDELEGSPDDEEQS